MRRTELNRVDSIIKPVRVWRLPHPVIHGAEMGLLTIIKKVKRKEREMRLLLV
jgi:hypothetical protein